MGQRVNRHNSLTIGTFWRIMAKYGLTTRNRLATVLQSASTSHTENFDNRNFQPSGRILHFPQLPAVAIRTRVTAAQKGTSDRVDHPPRRKPMRPTRFAPTGGASLHCTAFHRRLRAGGQADATEPDRPGNALDRLAQVNQKIVMASGPGRSRSWRRR